MILYNYRNYFGIGREETEEVEYERPGGPDTSVNFDYKRYQWLMMVEKICKELNYKPEEVYKLNYLNCLNWLSMWFLRDKIKSKNG